MNERIKLLAEQAGFTRRKFYGEGEYLTSPETPIESYCLDSELTKFAESIVKECINTLNGYDVRLSHNTQMVLLSDHFGVKE